MKVPVPPAPKQLIVLADGPGRAAPLGLVALVGAAVTAVAAVATGSPDAPVAARPTPAAASIALRPPPSLELVAPSELTVGDQVELEVRVRWPAAGPGELEQVEVACAADGCVDAAPARLVGWADPTSLAWAVPLTAREPGEARLRVTARPADGAATTTAAALVVRHPGRPVELVTNVELVGPDAVVRAALDPRAGELAAPRALELRVVPGLAAEIQLGLEGLATVPHGCFEQTTAATYPSVLTLELAQQSKDVPPELVDHARACAAAGSERLKMFQWPDGAFALHGPPMAPDPWLTAVGLAELGQLHDVIEVDRGRVQRAASALVSRWQTNDGDLRVDARSRGARGGAFAVTAYAAAALLATGEQPEAALRALRWLALHAEESARTPYERALAVKALLLGGPDHAAVGHALIPGLVGGATRHEDGTASWAACPTTTGTQGEAAELEVTALVAQALVRTGAEPELASAALRYLAAHRGANGFGGTQATVQALEAFRDGRSLREAGRGLLEVELGDYLPDAVSLQLEPGGALLTRALGAGEAAEGTIGRALASGVTLRFAGAGRVNAQLVLSGVVPWDDPAWTAGAIQATAAALRVRTLRPAAGRVGEVQRWKVVVENATARAVTDPMVEVGLPPGFELGPELGGLAALRAAQQVHTWDLGAGRLVLYVRDLAAGERVELVVSLVPTLVGDFSAGSLHAYPYYRPGEASAAAPLGVRVLPPRERAPALDPAEAIVVETATGPAAAAQPPADHPSASAGRAAPASEDEDEDGLPVGARRTVIAWDPRLGPLDLAAADLPHGAGPLARLVARALYRGLPSAADVVEVQPGRAWDFFLDPTRRWSDGRAVTVDDYLSAWSAARARAGELGDDLLVDPEQLALLDALEAEPYGPFTLRVRLTRPVAGALERLDGWPFLPRAPFPGPEGELVTNGRYRVLRAEADRLVLATSERGDAVVLRAGGADGAAVAEWVEPTDRADAVPLGTLSLALDQGQRWAFQAVVAGDGSSRAHELCRALGWLPLARGKERRAPSLVAAVTRADDPRLDEALRAIGCAGVRPTRAGSDDPPGREEVGALPSNLVVSRSSRARDALDSSGFLRYPLRVERDSND
jgi:hypothetical protein